MHRYGWISECWTKAPPKMFHIVLPQQGPFTWIKGFWQLDILDLLTLHGDHDVPKAWNLVWIFKRFTWTPQNQKGDFFWILPDPNSHLYCLLLLGFSKDFLLFCLRGTEPTRKRTWQLVLRFLELRGTSLSRDYLHFGVGHRWYHGCKSSQKWKWSMVNMRETWPMVTHVW